jgi:hypothetical protein
MKKRYWVVAAILLYAIGKLAGQPSDRPVAPLDGAPLSKQVLEKQTPKPATQKSLSPSLEEPVVDADLNNEESSTDADTGQTAFVTGTRVAFRAEPSKDGGIIDRFDRGRRVSLLRRDGDWSKVRDGLTQREGWLAARFLSADKPTARAESKKQIPSESQAKAREVETIPDSTIVQRIIAESIASYPSSCACPYNVDRGGRRCGKRSAYSKPGGYSPVCYAGDVSKSMMEAFANR